MTVDHNRSNLLLRTLYPRHLVHQQSSIDNIRVLAESAELCPHLNDTGLGCLGGAFRLEADFAEVATAVGRVLLRHH